MDADAAAWVSLGFFDRLAKIADRVLSIKLLAQYLQRS